jgi:hypothetical protein
VPYHSWCSNDPFEEGVREKNIGEEEQSLVLLQFTRKWAKKATANSDSGFCSGRNFAKSGHFFFLFFLFFC